MYKVSMTYINKPNSSIVPCLLDEEPFKVKDDSASDKAVSPIEILNLIETISNELV